MTADVVVRGNDTQDVFEVAILSQKARRSFQGSPLAGGPFEANQWVVAAVVEVARRNGLRVEVHG